MEKLGRPMDILAIGCCFILVFLCSCATPDNSRPSLPPAVPFSKTVGEDQPIFLTLHLENGKELLFFADTGAQGTVLDNSLKPLLGKRLETCVLDYNGLGVMTNGEIYQTPKLYLGSVQLLTGKQVYTDDLTRLSTGHPLMGILGMDCLRHYCLQLDLAAYQVRFLDPDQAAKEASGQSIPLALSYIDGKPRIRGKFLGQTYIQYLIDTGSPFDVALSTKRYEHELPRLKAQQADQLQVYRTWNPEIGASVRTTLFPELIFDKDSCTNFMLADCAAENSLGLRLLSRYVTTLDFPKRTMFLQPGQDKLFGDFDREANTFATNSLVTAHLALMKEALALMTKLKDKDQMPGWSKGEHGRLNISRDFKNDPANYPISLTFTATKMKDSSIYQYTLVKTSKDGEWKLQRAWRSDGHDHLLKEYSLP